MIARVQQATTLLLVAAALVWLAFFGWRGQPILALAGALVVSLGHAVVLAVELAMTSRSTRRDGGAPVSISALLSAWLAEIWCAPRVFCWRQPFRWATWPDRPDLESARVRRGVLLVHGFLCNRGVWNAWYPRLLALRIPHVGISLEPVFGSIDDYAAAIDRAVVALTHAHGLPPVIVAHSMGGLAVRAWLRAGGPATACRVHRVITLATPHQGTELVKIGLSPNLREMAPASHWLARLMSDEPSERAGLFVCLYSRCDNVVFPSGNAVLPGSESIELEACAHVQMVDHPRAFEVVLREVEEVGATQACRNERSIG